MTGSRFVLSRVRRPGQPPGGRYEYRIWPGLAHPAISILHRRWPFVAAERRADIYLLNAASERLLVKLRDGTRLEVKRRADDVGTIQHWTMPLAAVFPLTPSTRARLAVALALPGRLPAEAGLSPAHLLAELAASGAAILPRTVRKSRLLFQAGDCRAEICRVAVAGQTALTVALEAPDVPSIALATDRLQLGTLPNCSYGEALGRHRPMLTVEQEQERTVS